MALKASNIVFNSNSVTNVMLQESPLAPAINSGKLTVFHVEENANTGKSVNIYFIQKTADADSNEGLDMGIIANTETRGNNARFIRSVRSFSNTVNGKTQDIICDVKNQKLSLAIAGKVTDLDLSKFVIQQTRTTVIPTNGQGEPMTVGMNPVRNPNEGVLTFEGSPIFESTTVVTSSTGKPITSDMKHDGIMEEADFAAYLDSIGIDDFTKARMTKVGSTTTRMSEIGTRQFL